MKYMITFNQLLCQLVLNLCVCMGFECYKFSGFYFDNIESHDPCNTEESAVLLIQLITNTPFYS